MDSNIDLTGQECLLDFFDEEPLTPDIRERDIEDLISGRLNPSQGHRDLGCKFSQPRLNPFALLHRQLAPSRPHNNGGTLTDRGDHRSLSWCRLVIRGAKRNRTIRSWKFFGALTAWQSDAVNRWFT